MISKDIDAVDLLDYYTQLYDVQAEAHTPEYMLVHDEIRRLLKDCSSYTEFGVNQGTTLAIALLENTPTIRAYDIKLTPYNKAKHHFEHHAKKNRLDYLAVESNTLKQIIEPVDLLYIDTLHVYDHLKKELALHGNKARKYLVFHDTFKPTQHLKQAIFEFVERNPHWSVLTECDESVGFMTLIRRQA